MAAPTPLSLEEDTGFQAPNSKLSSCSSLMWPRPSFSSSNSRSLFCAACVERRSFFSTRVIFAFPFFSPPNFSLISTAVDIETLFTPIFLPPLLVSFSPFPHFLPLFTLDDSGR